MVVAEPREQGPLSADHLNLKSAAHRPSAIL
jgi:hypothetical protein